LTKKYYIIRAATYFCLLVINIAASVTLISKPENGYSIFSISLLASALCFFLLTFDTLIRLKEIKKKSKIIVLDAD